MQAWFIRSHGSSDVLESGTLPEPGPQVFIHAGAGGVGTMAIQLRLGARVATTASAASAARHELVRSLEADQVIDYPSERFRDVLRDCDVVLASVGGDSLARSFDVVRPGGVAQLATVADLVERGALRR